MAKADAEKLKKEDFEEEEEDDDDKFIASLANRKNKSPKNRNVAPKPQAKVERERKPQAKVKRERKNAKKEEEDDEDFEKSCSKKAPKRTDNKGQKKNKKEEKEEEEEEEEEENPEKTTRKRKTGEKKTFQKREKKVFDLPGQKRDAPGERDPSRIFYETLHKQVPASEMAAIWMMEFGLLPKDEAKKIFDRKLKRAKEQRLSSPMKTVVTVKRKANSITVEKKYANSPVSKAQKKRTPPSKAKSGLSKKPKIEDGEPSNDDTDDDFVVDAERSKKSGPSKKCKIKDGEPSDDDFAVDSGRSKKRRT